MKGTITLYVNGEYVCEREYESRYHRKMIIETLTKLHKLNNKEHYWQVLPPDIIDGNLFKTTTINGEKFII